MKLELEIQLHDIIIINKKVYKVEAIQDNTLYTANESGKQDTVISKTQLSKKMAEAEKVQVIR